MGIDNLGLAMITGDQSGAMIAGDKQSKANSVSGDPQDSLFQNLFSKILTQKSITAGTTGVAETGEVPEETKGIGSVLSELITGSVSSKKGTQNVGTVLNETGDELGDTLTDTDTTSGSDEASLAAIQAAMLGLADISPYRKEDKIIAQATKSGSEILSELNAVQETKGDLSVLDNHKYFFNENWKSGKIDASVESSAETENVLIPSGSAENDLITQGSSESILGAGIVTETDVSKADVTETVNSGIVAASTGKSGKNVKSMIQTAEGNLETPAVKNEKSEKDISAGTETKKTEDQNSSFVQNNESEDIATGLLNKSKSDSETETDQLGTENQNLIHNTTSVHKSAEVIPTAQSVEKTEIYKQVEAEIMTKLDQKGPTEFKMQLQPENLGQIDISLKLNEGSLVINILAESSKTQALLTSQVDKLISSMGLQNVQVESVQVNQQMNSNSQNSQNQGYQANSGMDFSQRRQNSQESGEGFQQNIFKSYGVQADIVDNVSPRQQVKRNLYKLDYAI